MPVVWRLGVILREGNISSRVRLRTSLNDSTLGTENMPYSEYQKEYLIKRIFEWINFCTRSKPSMKNSLPCNWSFLKEQAPFPFGTKVFHRVRWWIACQEGTLYAELEGLTWVESEQSLVPPESLHFSTCGGLGKGLPHCPIRLAGGRGTQIP